MSSDGSLDTRIRRIALLISLVVYAFGFWVNRGRALTDFRVLHLGGRLFSEGRVDEAYDPAEFAAIAMEEPELAERIAELDVFFSPPTFALAIRPFSLMPANIALIAWMALSIVGLVAAARLLRLPAWAGVVALAMPFGIANIYHAQTGFFAVVWAAAIHRLAVDDRKVAAGVVAGLAVLKPTLLLGVALWWLLDWRRWYPAMAAALTVGTALLIPTVLGGFGQWRAFLGALDAREAVEAEVVSNQPTFAEVVNRLFGETIGNHPLALLAYVAIGGALMFAATRRWNDHTDLLSAAAMIVSILVSPHMLIYDTGLVLIPLAVAASRGAAMVDLEKLATIYAVTSLMTIVSFEPFDSINGYIAPGTFGLVIAGLVWTQLADASLSKPVAMLSSLEGDVPPIDQAA